MKLRILIVTFAWPPRNSIGAHRPYSWAKYWSEAGAKVRVLTARKYAYDEPLDLNLPLLPEVEVIETDYGSGSMSVARRLTRGPLKRLAIWLYRRLRGTSLAVRNPRDSWLEAVRPEINSLACDTDVVVSTYDPRAVHQIAALMKSANPKLFWVADYRDLWGLNHVTQWTESQQQDEVTIERTTVGKFADLITSVSEDLSSSQGQWLKKPWLTVTNGFDVNLETLEAAHSRNMRAPDGCLRIVYTGKIYPGSRDPGPLLEEVLALEAEGAIQRGAITLDIYGGQVDGIETYLSSGTFSHIMRLHGHVPRERALEAQNQADLLLLLESPLAEARGVLTGKVFEYLASGVPILSLGSRCDSAIGELLAKTRSGLCSEDAGPIIRSVLLDRIEGKVPEWFAPDLSAISEYSRETQALKLLNALPLADLASRSVDRPG